MNTQLLNVDSVRNAEPNTCVLDGVDYLDWYDHVYTDQGQVKDPRHDRFIAEAQEDRFDHVCICGTKLQITEYGDWQGNGGWYVECPQCQMMFDES